MMRLHQINTWNFMWWHFFNQAGIICKSATCPLRSQVLWLTEASSLRQDSLRTSPRNETVKLSRCQMIVVRYPMERPSGTRCRTWWYHSWHSHLKSALFCIHSSMHSFGHFTCSQLQCWCLVAPHRDQPSGTHHDVWHIGRTVPLLKPPQSPHC